ncbi:hypothetical protein NQ317_008438 [Molorchus minor]|uniref:Helicase ATP-binding domain-containing protein n=1 Tax=Molorchus minor TaxID=1323400 RepID=A0ABQ9JEX6_9CUCU|nr:hypothetical protein NQ317_008438 [Molorchus minor]
MYVWPEEIKFIARDTKKRLASHKSALAALHWLDSKQKITKKGAPVIYEKDEITTLTNKTVPILFLDNITMGHIHKIVELHQKEIAPYILKIEEKNRNSDTFGEAQFQEPDDVNLKPIKKQRYIGLKQYLAKEKVKLPITAYKDAFINLLRESQGNLVMEKVQEFHSMYWRLGQKKYGLLCEPARIAVTQPRRIAAISLAQRVAIERDEAVGSIIGYQVRLNSNFSPTTGRVLYCTTGILLRHLQSDPTLSNFTHIILDEAHERDVNTDLLMNLLRGAIKTNPKLKLVVMSATIDTNVFCEYFGGAPVMEVPGFAYPVRQNFWTPVNPLILLKPLKCVKAMFLLLFMRMLFKLQDSEQWKIFSEIPPGIRKIILATNIAETSVTIDDVVYVIDTGIQKEQRFDIKKGVNCLDNHWISKASVNQRKGRVVAANLERVFTFIQSLNMIIFLNILFRKL